MRTKDAMIFPCIRYTAFVVGEPGAIGVQLCNV